MSEMRTSEMRTSEMNAQSQHPGMSCRDAAELLPWLINGSLENGARRSLMEHVAACARCRGELEETVEAWELLTRHLPSFALVEYGLGVEPEGLERERIERHLAVCPQCREELAWVRADGVIEFEEARSRASGARASESVPARTSVARRPALRIRRWALAAGLAGALLAGGLVGALLELGPTRSTAQLAKAGDGRDRYGHEPGGGVLFRDGFDSGDVGSWSTNQSSGQPHR